MQKFALSVAAMALFVSTVSTPARGADYTVDAVHSAVLFKIRHADVGHFYGFFKKVAGTLVYDAAAPETTKLEVTVDAGSIDTNNPQRDTHVKSADYFNVKQYPTFTFKSTSVKATDDKTLAVTGDLTVKGVTRSISVTLHKTGEGDRGAQFGYRAAFETTFKINRTEYGMDTKPGLGDEVELTVSFEAVRK